MWCCWMATNWYGSRCPWLDTAANSVAPDRRDTQPLYVAIVIVGLGAAIVFFTSLFVATGDPTSGRKVAKQASGFVVWKI